MITVTYLPLFVTVLFRGMPGIWKSRHRLILYSIVLPSCGAVLFPLGEGGGKGRRGHDWRAWLALTPALSQREREL
jgi:hypothetical protein